MALSGCNARQNAPVAEIPTATPTPLVMPQTPRATPKPRPKPHPKPRIVYGIATKRRVLALTFDDGPDPTWTPKVIAILQKWHVPATFFMVGKMVRAHPQFAEQVKNARFPIGNHTWSHPRATLAPRPEIERTDAIIQRTLHLKTTMFRPPYGLMDNGLAKCALASHKDVINWNSLGADWDHRATAQSIEAKVERSAKPGGITLLHDGGGNRSQTVAALPHIIQNLRARGFRFVTVPELLEMGSPLRTHVSLVPHLKRRRGKRIRLATHPAIALQTPKTAIAPRPTSLAKPTAAAR